MTILTISTKLRRAAFPTVLAATLLVPAAVAGPIFIVAHRTPKTQSPRSAVRFINTDPIGRMVIPHPAPEPPALVLLGSGLAAMAMFIRGRANTST